jgi:hypothetical protein
MNTNPGALSAAEARALFRAGTVAPTAGRPAPCEPASGEKP